MMQKNILGKLVLRENLSYTETKGVFNEALAGNLGDGFLGAFLTALKMKGETAAEIYAGASALRENAIHPDIDGAGLLDTCGTGGDNLGTFNVSTATAFICAAAGVRVAKHGNRSVSSKCGSFDVLEALGCNINLQSSQVVECINRTGIGFMYAPIYHGAMKNVAGIRKELGFRTIFNILGPLANPAEVDRQLLGVYSLDLMDAITDVLKKFSLKKALVVHGSDGADEITIAGETFINELNNDMVSKYIIHPEMFGIEIAEIEKAAGGDANCNAGIIRGIFCGLETGAKKDLLIINAGAALYTAGYSSDISGGVQTAKDIITSGAAMDKLNEYIAVSDSVRGEK